MSVSEPAGPSPWFTLVTEGSCEACGLTPSVVLESELGEAIQREAQAWRSTLLPLASLPALRIRPADDVWSANEYGAHTRDTVVVFLERLEFALREHEPRFAYQDQERRARECHYNELDPRTIVRELGTLAARFSALLDGLRDEQWARGGERLPGERFDIKTLARFALHEVRHHRVDAERSAKLALERNAGEEVPVIGPLSESDEALIFDAYAAAVDEAVAFPRTPPATFD